MQTPERRAEIVREMHEEEVSEHRPAVNEHEADGFGKWVERRVGLK